MTQRIAESGILVQIVVLEESVFDAQCVVTAALQQKHCVIIYVSSKHIDQSHPYMPQHRSLRVHCSLPKWL